MTFILYRICFLLEKREQNTTNCLAKLNKFVVGFMLVWRNMYSGQIKSELLDYSSIFATFSFLILVLEI